MLSTMLPVHHLYDDQTTEISSLSNVQSLTSSMGSLLPSHDTRGNALLYDLLPPAAFQISTSHREHPAPSSPSLSSNGIFPITASEFQRYERNVLLPRVSRPSYQIKSLTTSFPSNMTPSGWTSFAHPEGALYFWDAKRDIFTEADISNARIYSALEVYIQRIESYIMTQDIQLPAGGVDLVLDLRLKGNDKYECGYYFANHETRCLFWLHNHDVSGILEEVKVPYSLSHVGQEIESQYWNHRELFPNNRAIDGDIVHELKDRLIHALGDSMTSHVSTAPYSVAELEKFLYLVKEMKDQVNTVSPGSACTLYRLMRACAHEKFLQLHGQQGARLCRNQSIHGDMPGKPSLLFRCLNSMMFNMAMSHVTTLRSISADQLVNQSTWSLVLKKVAAEWKDVTFYSMLLLNGNITLLTVGASANNAVATQLACYLSTVISVASTMTGVLLSRHSQTKHDPDFLANRSVSSAGLELLSVMYALPHALLMWGIISFLAALGCVCLGSGNIIIGSLITTIVWAILVLIVIWILSTPSEEGPYREPWIIRKLSDWTTKEIHNKGT